MINRRIVFLAIVFIASFLRLYNISDLPPSLYWEEVALGYDAYSILKTGKDHHGTQMPLVAFESFGDWKPSLYFYAIVPFITLFDLSELAVRLPSALSGIAIVIGAGYLSRLVHTIDKRKQHFSANTIQILTMALAAVSPWGILFSRAAWEANLATALMLWGVVFGLVTLKKIQSKLPASIPSILCVVFLVLSLYSYHASRLTAPLLGVALGISWLLAFHRTNKKSSDYAKFFLPLLVFSIFSLYPFVASWNSPQVSNRFAETSIFSDLKVIEESNLYREIHGDSLINRLVSHRYILFSREIAKNFLSHFSYEYLFVSGDENVRHSTQAFGILHKLDVLFLLSGLGYFILLRRKSGVFLFYWLVVGIFPASLTHATPHALRTLSVMPVFMVVISFGAVYLYQLFTGFSKNSNISQKILNGGFVLLALVYAMQFHQFWHYYTTVYPNLYTSPWQYGYKQMVKEVRSIQEKNPGISVYISRAEGRPAMYYWFFTKTDPREVQKANDTASKTLGEFLEFQQVTFYNDISDLAACPCLIATTQENEWLGVTDEYQLEWLQKIEGTPWSLVKLN